MEKGAKEEETEERKNGHEKKSACRLRLWHVDVTENDRGLRCTRGKFVAGEWQMMGLYRTIARTEDCKWRLELVFWCKWKGMPTWKCVTAFAYLSDAAATKVKNARSLPEKKLERSADKWEAGGCGGGGGLGWYRTKVEDKKRERVLLNFQVIRAAML
jgi:hypothetical protein